MSMPHGETTGRSRPCSTCGAGGGVVDCVPRFAHQLVYVAGDPTINTSKEPGVFEAVGDHLVIGYPLLRRGNETLLWVRTFAFPQQPGERGDNLSWDRRCAIHTALTVPIEVEGFKNLALVWVPTDNMLHAVPSNGRTMPSDLYHMGRWYSSYSLLAEGDAKRKLVDAPQVQSLDFANVRAHLIDRKWMEPSLPDSVMHWLKGFEIIPPMPAPPKLVPLEAEAAPLAAAAACNEKAAMPGFGAALRGLRLSQIAVDFRDKPFVQFPTVRGMMAGLKAKHNLPKWKEGDKVVWHAPASDKFFAATVVDVGDTIVTIAIANGSALRDWLMTLASGNHPCHGWLPCRRHEANDTIVIKLDSPSSHGTLRRDLAAMPMMLGDHEAVFNPTPSPLESDPPEVAFAPVIATDLPPPTKPVVDNGGPLGAFEQEQVFSALAQYVANMEDIEGRETELARVMDFFIDMRKQLRHR